ncbi:TetR family transcriptional regulator [Leptospira perolatii]|uniref:TetR family transcriptional regulator n=1 Tax=Leptospira perolatii TaxID=2023191 RepID=A0A2M9ZKI4_9LEPT|nr:TetR/AcrR family transcriptional regulator C-terminal domain-containing protein [Leptospira perolatii]PJZ69413.1 TetR family transcriptional regulator [Leptospira perolatii]PJZ72548.1 TetR family transcriptional regulator [Leptospira perolatii]
MPRNPKFSREQLQKAALSLVDKKGLEALSMRNLAASVGTGAMTIYNYVSDRAELESMLVEAVMSEVKWSPRPGADWKQDVRDIALAMWKAARIHPHVIPLILTRRSFAPAMLDPTEALLDALYRGGLTGGDLLVSFRTVSGFATGIAQAELAGPFSISKKENMKKVISRFQSLPKEKYPRLIEIANAARESNPEREFTTGLNVIIFGLEVYGKIKRI